MTVGFGGQNGKNLPGYTATNVRLDWNNVAGTGLDLGGYVRNLFGEHYYVSPSVLLLNFPTSSVYVGEPRTWGLMARRSEEHTSELQSLMRISYAVFCLKKKKQKS